MWWCGRMGSFSSVYSLSHPIPLSPLLSLPYLLWPNSALQSGLCSGLMWNLRNICSFLFQENDLRDWMCFFFLLAVKLWSCPVWFFDDGKESSKCFLSEFHVIILKAWFLSWAPPPPTPWPRTQCHLFCQQWEEVHIVPVTITALLLAHTHTKMATVSILHKSYFKCSLLEDHGSAYCCP